MRLENRCWLSCLLLKSETPSLLLICSVVLWGTTGRACSGEERGTDPLKELCVDGGGETIVKFES